MADLQWDRAAIDVIRQAARRGVEEAAVMFQTQAKGYLSRPGRGQQYDVAFRTIDGKSVPMTPDKDYGLKAPRYRASKPGDPPTVQTGTLRRSVQIDRSGIGALNPSARVGTGRRYGFWLEFGTRRIKPRPWMRPTYSKTRRPAQEAIATRIGRGINQVRGV